MTSAAPPIDTANLSIGGAAQFIEASCANKSINQRRPKRSQVQSQVQTAPNRSQPVWFLVRALGQLVQFDSQLLAPFRRRRPVAANRLD